MTIAHIENSLVTVDWLIENSAAENLIIFEASMKPIGSATPTAPEHRQYIPGSVRFDFDNEICDHESPLPHTMPTAAAFTAAMQTLGVNQDSAIVVYDQVGVYSSPRAWWMLRAMGHQPVAVLDGGLPAWIAAVQPTVTGLSIPTQRGNFISQPKIGSFVDSTFVSHALNDSSYRVLDARSAGRFSGNEPEPRAGMRGGHMPGAANLPISEVVQNGNLISPKALQSKFEPYHNKRLVFSCGSGVTACVLALAADQAGLTDVAVYDGSWSEWGAADSGLPVTSDATS